MFGRVASDTSPLRSRGVPRVLMTGFLGLLSLVAVTGNLGAQAAVGPNTLSPMPNSMSPQVATARVLGHHSLTAPMTVEILMQPQHQNEINALIQAQYTPGSTNYHQWLPSGYFDRRYGPTLTQQVAVANYMKSFGLHLVSASSVFLMRFAGTSGQVERAFHTQINDYRLANGKTGFANANNISMPLAMNATIQGVLGLNTLPQQHTNAVHPRTVSARYGAGPSQGGLTPSQVAGIYNATGVHTVLKTNGAHVTIGLFELSQYTSADFATYISQFGLNTPSITTISTDGGATDHSGAIEVELDVEMALSLADGANIQIYSAPNTDTSIVDQYQAIATQNTADVVSTSWGECEAATTTILRDGEFDAFQKMASQGQSLFAASGDSGAFDCLTNLSNGSNQVDDPASQPYVTGVGGTSFLGTFDPGTTASPKYPTAKGAEYVWNSFNNCTNTGCFGGASGGGNSRYWAKPGYQAGPGVVSGYSKYGAAKNGWCSQPVGVQCREVPDVSIDADPYTAYSMYCTDVAGGCQYVDGNNNTIVGWQEVGGTSSGTPLWADIAVLADSYHSTATKTSRMGLLNWQIYSFDNATSGYVWFMHDPVGGSEKGIAGGQVLNNGWFPEATGYDQATGVGTPNIYYLVQRLP